MTPTKSRPEQSATPIIIAYYVSLGLLVLGAFLSGGRTWGFNWWHFVPLWMQITLGAVGITGPFLARLVTKTDFLNFASAPHTSGKRFWLVSLGGIVVLTVIFWLGRNQSHFLGDGYQILTLIQGGQTTHKLWDATTMFIETQVFRLFGGQTVDQAATALQAISVASGVGVCAVTLASARKIGMSFVTAWVLTLGVLTSGLCLLFFGYIETYPPFTFALATTCLLGVLICENKISRWWLLPAVILALSLHLFAVAILPAVIYALSNTTELWRRFTRISPLVRYGSAVVAAIAAVLVAVNMAQTNYVFRFWFVPPVSDEFTVDGYTLFSVLHLADLLNLLLVLLPALPLMITVLSGTKLSKVFHHPSYRFLAVALLGCLIPMLVLDPKLGMPRDWDLFSFVGVPLVLFWLLLVLDQRIQIKYRAKTILLTMVLGSLVLIPRVAIFASRDRSVQVAKSYLDLDRIKTKNFCVLVGQELEEWGRVVEATEMLHLVKARYPEIDMYDLSLQKINQGQVGEGVRLAGEALRRNPIYYDAYSALGAAYLAQGQLDDALRVYRICHGLNPRNSRILYNLATVYARMGNTIESRRWLERSLEIDSTFAPSIIGSALVSVDEKRFDEIPMWLDRLSAAPNIDPMFVSDLIEQLLKKNQYLAAARAIAIGQQHGLDSASVAGFVRDFPQLSSHLK